jgi:glutathione reductase (NADPH)
VTSDYDFVAIGAGNTGLSAAYRVADAGRRVAIVDPGPIGGLCSLAGCNPKKVFVRATEVLDEVRRSGEHGIRTGKVSIDWARVLARKHGFTDPVPAQTEKSLRDRGIDWIPERARFTAPDAIRAGDRALRASGFLVATGSHPRRLKFPGAELVRTTNDVLELADPPARMAIIGAGVVAAEFGQVFARLGTRVTILMRGTRALSGFDADVVEAFQRFSVGLGIEFRANVRVQSASESPGGGATRIELSRDGNPDSIEAEFVLNAAGRVSAVESLDLGAAGVEASEKGIVVDEFLRSPRNRRVFAGGDAHGEPRLSPVASYEGRIAARNFLRGDVERADYSTIPRAVYVVPPLGAVGQTEEEARRAGLDVEVASNDISGWRVYAIAGEPAECAKVVVEKGSGRLVGAQLYGAGAAEIINIFAVAMKAGLTAEGLQDFVFTYPTFSSAITSLFPGPGS